MSIGEVLVAILMVSGVAFVLLASMGLWRFDDVFSRIHAATKATTLGVLLVVAAAALRVENGDDVLKLALAAVLQLISAPVSGHMLGRAAYWAGTDVSRHLIEDHLHSDLAERTEHNRGHGSAQTR